MSDNSFYGGIKGASFIIVARYASIAEMIKAFSGGGSYTAVNYDEYVIIDTENKNDPDNGKLYRRGYSYNDEMGGAQYVGQIVGPSGLAPFVEITSYEDAKSKQAKEGYESHVSFGEYAPTADLVPGKVDGKEQYNDSIKWYCASIRDNYNRDAIAYIGFIFPYLVVDYTAESVSPYYNRSNQTNNFVNQNLVTRTDNKQHPYWEKWNISVPKGITGDAFKNLRVIKASSTDGVQSYTGKSDDYQKDGKTPGREILVYDYYHYDKDSNGEPVSLYLGDFNMIDGITFDEEGTFTITYTHDNLSTWKNLVKWIKSISLNPDTGHFTITYNYSSKNGEPTQYDIDLTWVKSIQLAHNGTITVTRTTDSYNLNEKIRWIDQIELAANGTIKVVYNTGETTSFDKMIQWITKVQLDADGHFKVEYNNEASAYETNLVWISSIDLADDGTIKFIENNGTEHKHEKYLKHISNISVNTEGNQKLHIVYNTGDEEDIGDPLNYIVETVICPDDFHLLVYYSDPALRQQIVNEGKNHTYNGKNDWFDLGAIKDEDGILIGLNIDENDVVNFEPSTVINYLNQTYPNGLVNAGMVGKIATAGRPNDIKRFYAFDYNKNTWYYLGIMSIDFSIEEDGTVHLGTNQNDGTTYEKLMKWIDSVTLAQDGTFVVHYNNGSDDYTTTLKWIKDATLTQDGTFTIYYNDDTQAKKSKLKWIDDASLAQNGDFTVYYNDNTQAKKSKLKWVEDVIVNDNSSITVRYNNGDSDTTYDNWNNDLIKRMISFATEKAGPSKDLVPYGVWYVVE